MFFQQVDAETLQRMREAHAKAQEQAFFKQSFDGGMHIEGEVISCVAGEGPLSKESIDRTSIWLDNLGWIPLANIPIWAHSQ